MQHNIVQAEEQAPDFAQVEANAQRASELLKAMSNRYRLLILCQLSKGEHNVGQLENMVGLSQSALSQHLARLRKDNLVQTRRNAQTIYYSLNGRLVERMLQTLHDVFCPHGP